MRKSGFLLGMYLLIFSSNIHADDCTDWFNKLELNNDPDCVVKCATAPTGMGTFTCTSKCKELCRSKKSSETKLRMSISEKGIIFLSAYEGFSKNIYLDAGGNKTVGYGHLILDGEDFPRPVTIDEAKVLLAKDLEFAISAVNESVKVKLKQNEFDSLVSFAFNIGVGAFKSSTILKRINTGDLISSGYFSIWNKVNGKVVPGLSKRRRDEFELFKNGDYEIIKDDKGAKK